MVWDGWAKAVSKSKPSSCMIYSNKGLNILQWIERKIILSSMFSDLRQHWTKLGGFQYTVNSGTQIIFWGHDPISLTSNL